MKRYVLKKGDYYLLELYIKDNELKYFSLSKEIKRIYTDFEEAEENRKLIFIETGLDLQVKIYRKEEK